MAEWRARHLYYHFAQEPDEGLAQLPVGERQQTATNPVVDVIGPSLFEGSSCSRHCSLRFDANKSAKQCLARLKGIESAFPELAIPFHPLGGFVQWLCFELAAPNATVPCPVNESGAFEHLQVLGDRRPRDLEGRGQPAYRGLADRQPGEDSPPGRVCEGSEDEVELLIIGNHLVTHYASMRPIVNSSGLTSVNLDQSQNDSVPPTTLLHSEVSSD